MQKKIVSFKNPSGLHARPAAKVVEIAQSFENCCIHIATEEKIIDAKSILSLIIQAIPSGSILTVQAEGIGEREAVEQISNYLSQESIFIEE